MINRQELEEALATLDNLLKNDVSDEAAYQRLLEDYPVVFSTLGYKRAFPKLRFDLPNNEFLEPDFMLEKVTSLFDVFELKTPQEKLIKPTHHRESFYALIHSYISQARTYSEYFDDDAHRLHVRDKYSIEVQKRPDVTILVGRDKDIDKSALHLLARRETGSLTIMTFDDLLSHLYSFYRELYGATEDLVGASLHFGIVTHEISVVLLCLFRSRFKAPRR